MNLIRNTSFSLRDKTRCSSTNVMLNPYGKRQTDEKPIKSEYFAPNKCKIGLHLISRISLNISSNFIVAKENYSPNDLNKIVNKSEIESAVNQEKNQPLRGFKQAQLHRWRCKNCAFAIFLYSGRMYFKIKILHEPCLLDTETVYSILHCTFCHLNT